jgi:hypothetical protein
MKPSAVLSGIALAAAVLSLQASVMYFAVAKPLGGALAQVDRAHAEGTARAPARPTFVEVIEVSGGRRS